VRTARFSASSRYSQRRPPRSSPHGAQLQLANLKPLEQQNAGVAGLVEMTADIAADLRKTDAVISNINADFSGRGLKVHGQDAGNLTATARTTNGT